MSYPWVWISADRRTWMRFEKREKAVEYAARHGGIIKHVSESSHRA